jgi:hypothetical protein
MNTTAATAAAIRPDRRDGVFVFPHEWDIPTIEKRNSEGWIYLDLRHLEAPRKLRHAAVLADGRVLLPAMLWFRSEQEAHEAILHYQRPMAEERFRGTLLVEVELLRIRMEPDSDADRLVVELVEIVEATIAGRVKADYVTLADDDPDGLPSPSMNSHSPR